MQKLTFPYYPLPCHKKANSKIQTDPAKRWSYNHNPNSDKPLITDMQYSDEHYQIQGMVMIELTVTLPRQVRAEQCLPKP